MRIGIARSLRRTLELIFHFNRRSLGRLRQLIDAINAAASCA